MMHKFGLISYLFVLNVFFPFQNTIAQENPTFLQNELNFNGNVSFSFGVTSLMYGPDDRLYVAEYPSGGIKALTIQRNSATDYKVTSVEVLDGIITMPDHNDDGSIHSSNNRQVTGLTVSGTSTNPIVYVSSSDIRIGAGVSGGNGDVGLDTNSGVITRFTWNGGSWDVVDLVRGLPRSEENHATNGLEFTTINGTNYLIVASGGFTNAGGPSENFVYSSEYALSGAILSIDLDAINALPVLTDNGRSYIYDLPTLDDPLRVNQNGIIDPDNPNYDGIDVNDPFGGNDGLNQAIVLPGGPVQIFSPGYRNAYDLVVTQSGALYVTDNGANPGWGGFPVNEGGGSATNEYDINEPGSQSLSGAEQVDNLDHLELVTNDLQSYVPGSFYGGHPNPTRANPNGAGLYTAQSPSGNTGAVFRTLIYDPDGSRGAGYTTDSSIGLPANWPPVPIANSIEGDWRGPGTANPDGPNDNPIAIWANNTNGIDEYTASNFGGVMQGDLLAGHSSGTIRRAQLNADGGLQNLNQTFLSGIGGNALGITCNGDFDMFPGTIWAGTLDGKIVVFEPTDAVACISPGETGYDASADYDNDGYSNQDEEYNFTDPCNGGSQPEDFDKSAGGTLISDLNDLDDDADGILDAVDPFQLGDPNTSGSDAFALPISNDLFTDQQGLDGIFGLGMTGLMNNGNTDANWLDWIDRKDDSNDPNPNDVLGGASGLMTSHMTSGSAMGSTNTQEKAYQYGVQTSSSTGQFTVSGNLINLTGPLRLYGNSAAIGGELGYFIGDGTQSNFIKIVLTAAGVTALQEINDVPQTPINISIPISKRPDADIVFYFIVDTSSGQVGLQFAIDGGLRNTITTISAQGSILNAIQQASQDLAVGLIGTSGTSGVELEGTWDFLNVAQDEQNLEFRVNAGGPSITTSEGQLFLADQSFMSGLPYENSGALVSTLYQTERSSSTLAFQYEFPVENGDYFVILHFAEIFWGATGKPAGGPGKRVFDVSLEQAIVLDDYDIFADVGAETPVLKSFPVTVDDGTLEIDFSALPSDGGIDQPKVSAIEIIRLVGNEAPVAAAQATPLSGEVPFEVTFTGSGSTDDKDIVSYLWDFGDGNTSTEQDPIYIFSSEGTYDVTLTVEDIEGLSSTDTITIDVSTPSSEESILINAGGTLLTNNGEVFEADRYFVGGEPYSNIDAQVSELYLTERSSPISQFAYDIPLSDGEYVVKLYFAEIFWGATGKPAGGIGKRVFDVTMEGSLVLDDYDIYADVGAEIPVIKTFSIAVADGNLNIDFSALSSTGGVNEPKVSAIEILPAGQFLPIEVDPIVDQNNLVGEDIGSLAVSASGGDSSANFVYSIFGQPEGILIEPTNGLIYGTIAPNALNGGLNNDGVHTVTIRVAKTGSASVEISFVWTIVDSQTCLWNDLADSGPGRFETLSQSVGDKLYVIGGWISRIPPLIISAKNEIYDTTSDIWSLGAPMPVPVTHMGNTVVGDEIWSVGGFTGNDPGVATDIVQIYNTTTDTWRTGPSLPVATGSGALAISGNKLHYFGGLAADRLTDIGNHYVLDLANVNAGWSTAAPLPNPRNHLSGISVDGIVYAIGGQIGHDGPVQDTKFLHSYNPSTDQWTRLADLSFERSHMEPATTVHNGKIIIVGGRQVNLYFDEVTQYDPLSNTWTELCKLPEKLLAPTAKVFNNRLIISGGGINGFTEFSNATKWLQLDPVEEPPIESCSWNDLTDSFLGRFETRSEKVGDKLYVFGGWLPGTLVAAQTEIYDTVNDSWSYGADMPIPVTHMGSAVVGNDIWIIGGFPGDNSNPSPAVTAVQIYNTLIDSWSTGPDLPNAYASGASTLNGNKIHYFGGLLADRQTDVGDHYVVDLGNIGAGWTTAAPLPNPRNHHSAESVNGIVYSIGGQYGHDASTQDTKLLHAYNPATDQWTSLSDLPVERSHFEPGTSVHNGKIIIVGGRKGNTFFDEVTQYDPQLNTWTELCVLPENLMAPVAQPFGDRLIVSSGGVNGTSNLTLSTRWLQLEPEVSQFNWIDKDENENYTGRHECNFTQVGDQFYLLGGRESALVESYDYSSDAWTQLGSAPKSFSHFQAMEYQGLIWAIGAVEGNNYPNDIVDNFIWIYSPLTDEWLKGPEIPAGRVRGSSGAIVYNDKFYIVGGNTNGHAGGYVSWFDEYDPATGIWTPLADAPRARDHFQAILVGTELYAIGGRQTGDPIDLDQTELELGKPLVAEVDVYNFVTGLWSTLPANQNLPTPRAGAATVNYNDKIVVIGGEVYQETVDNVLTTDALKVSEEFDPITGVWTRMADLNSQRHGHQAIVSGNGIHVIAGSPNYKGGIQKNMESYGEDNPIGSAITQSALTTQADLIFDTNSVLDISLGVADGDTGIWIRSMIISGPSASSFSIANGELSKALIKANTSHNLAIDFNGVMGETAQLTINYGLNNELVVPLSTGTAEDLAFSQERGFYNTPFDLGLSTGMSGASIRYTLDGTAPSQTNGIVYSGTIAINTTTTVRAIAYSASEETSLVTHSYIFLDDVVQQPANISGWPNNVYNLGTGGAQATHDYEMDPDVVNAPEYSGAIKPGLTSIPTMSIVMNKDDFWTVYDGEVGIDGSIEILYPDDAFPSEHFIAEVESHSHLRLKRSLKLDINNNVTSNLLKTGPLTGNTATTDFTDTKFVLRGGNNRAWSRNWNQDRTAFTRDEWYRASQVSASGIGMRGTFVHLYVNGLYWGLYNPVQRQDAGFMASYFGGEPDDYMTLNHNGVKNGDSSRFDYLMNTLVNQDMSIQANYEETKQYIDIENFIDYLMVTWSMGMTDWPLNNFYGGNRNNPAEPFNYYSWDGEWSWDTTLGSNNGAWVHPFFRSDVTGSEPISELWHSLRTNSEFMQLFVDRVNLQFFNDGPLSDNASRARWATVNQYIETAVIAESARWGDGLNDGQTRTKNDDWAPEVARLDELMNGNAERFLEALRAEGYYPALDAVVLNKPGGSVIPSFELEMTNLNLSGTIYYTTDGSDPQLTNGNVSTSAIVYNGPIAIPTAGILEINARINDGADWSANTVASYARMELYINEFLASNVTGITDESGDLEDWIEFYNAGVLPVDLGGMYITDDLIDLTQWQIPDNASEQTTIPAGGFLYVWADKDIDDGPLHVNIKLGSGGEAIGLSIDGPAGLETIDSYVFGPQTADISIGRFADGEANFVALDNPTPGAPNEIGFLSGIFINEFLAGNTTGITDEAGDLEDWIEIYNSNDIPVDIGGLYVTDDLANPLLFQIPTDNPTATTIPPGGFIILWADSEPLEGPLHLGLKLGKGGEDIGLTQVIGVEQQFIDSLTFGAQSDDVSSGREPDGGSTVRFYFEPTPGSSNIIPFIAGLSINEALAVNTNSISDSNGDNDPWIEVYNLNAEPIDIGGLYVSNDDGNPSLWQIPNTNPTLTTIPAGGFITLWADNQTNQGELHLPFTLNSSGGSLLISDIIGNDISTINTMVYSSQTTDVSFGRYPDASEQFKSFNQPTPGNNNILPLITNVYINEYLAGNVAANSDEAGEFDDWIELYNAGSTSVDVGGLFIVDDLAETDPFQIPTTSPSETTIPAGGYLLLWADKQESQGVLHVGIKLSGGGEQIGLMQINGDDTNFIDSLTYLAQTDDISEGRSPDGGPTFVSFTTPTPNASNSQVLSVTTLMLVDAITNEDIMSLTDGLQISLSELPTTSLNIRANTTNDVGSVFFDLTGALVKSGTESVQPFALYGDSNGSYNAQTFVLGTYTLNVTPYSAASLGGTQGFPFAITFEMVQSTTPSADAGSDQNIILPSDSVVLDGSGSSDPDGGDIAVYAWTQQSGPTTATLSGASAAQLTASDLEEGDYVFRLTVTDDESETAFDEVMVTVAPEGVDGIWLEAECAIVGSGWTVIDDATVSNGQYLQTPAGTHLTSTPTNTSLWVTFEFQATAGPYSVHALAGVNSPADDSFWVRANGGTWIKWNKVAFSSTFVWDQVHDSDNGAQPVSFNLVSGTNTIDISLREDGALLDKLYVTSTTDLPTGLGGNSGNCVFVSQPPVADAGVDQDILLPTNSVVLTGSGNDPDGGSIVSYAWTQESGPSTATRGGEATAQLVASNLEEGIYIFRLTVTDDEGDTGFEDITVTVITEVLNGVVWLEDFEDLSNGAVFDNGATAWTSSRPAGTFEVSNGTFLTNNKSSVPGIWTSEIIPINGTVSISMDVDDGDDKKEASDFVRAYYSVDSGPQILFGSVSDDIAAQTFTTSGITGSTVQIVVEAVVSFTDEFYYFDNITVFGEPTGVVEFPLTVNNGTGDGVYPAGTDVDIIASAAPIGQEFDVWTGDVSGISDVNNSTTILTMPSGNVTITATYRDLPTDGVVWLEDFEDLSNGAVFDNGATAWTSSRPAGTFAVSNGTFLTNNKSSVPGIWTSEVIPINGTVSISMDVDDGDDKKEANDFVRAYYIVDGGQQLLFGSVSDDIAAQTFTTSGITGSTIQIVVEAVVSFADEFYYIDNITVTQDGISGKSYNTGSDEPNSLNLDISSFESNPKMVTLNDVYIFPNPTGAKIGIRVANSNPNILNISLYDLTGKLVRLYSKSAIVPTRDGIEVPIESIRNGIYMVQIDFENNEPLYFKVIVQN